VMKRRKADMLRQTPARAEPRRFFAKWKNAVQCCIRCLKPQQRILMHDEAAIAALLSEGLDPFLVLTIDD